MRFGQPLDDERLISLLAPDEAIATVITADVYGAGDADLMLGRALAGCPREQICVAGAVGHDFYTGERDGAKGFPRFTDPRLRDSSAYGDYLQMATERSLERCGIDSFDLLLLHNPDRVGYTGEIVWTGMAALRDGGLTRMIGVAPRPVGARRPSPRRRAPVADRTRARLGSGSRRLGLATSSLTGWCGRLTAPRTTLDLSAIAALECGP
jgi:aryl-alcohol dehydrogenase-like predicted oxidoreductase